MDEDIAVPIISNAQKNMETEEILDIFRRATEEFSDKISNVPPVLPIEGEVYLFDLGPDSSLWDKNKKKFR